MSAHKVSNERIDIIVLSIKDLKAIEKSIKEQKEKLIQSLHDYMLDAETLINPIDGDEILSWKYTKDKKVFDLNTFKVEQKDVYDKYTILKPGDRRLLIK